jgi:hypothetical protein
VLVGIPTEIKSNEYRVAMTPAGVHELTLSGHDVVVEAGAGLGSSIRDVEYQSAGARIVANADEVWADAELICKVKEPIADEYHRMRRGQVLFTYLHLAASRECTQALLDAGVTAIAYETVQTSTGHLPLLAPMSEVAGRMATQVGAHVLERGQGGRGILLGGVTWLPWVYWNHFENHWQDLRAASKQPPGVEAATIGSGAAIRPSANGRTCASALSTSPPGTLGHGYAGRSPAKSAEPGVPEDGARSDPAPVRGRQKIPGDGRSPPQQGADRRPLMGDPARRHDGKRHLTAQVRVMRTPSPVIATLPPAPRVALSFQPRGT